MLNRYILKNIGGITMNTCKFLSLRERTNKANESSLSEYLEYIFPDTEIIYDSIIPKEIQEERCRLHNLNIEFKRYRPDARIESESIIVEFYGINHFQSPSRILHDWVKESYLEDLGYKVITIPFYVQLTKDMIKFYFNKDVQEGSKVKSGFYSTTKDKTKLNPNCPASFSSLGYRRFLMDLEEYPKSTQQEIIDSLKYQQQYNPGLLVLPDILSPEYAYKNTLKFLNVDSKDPSNKVYNPFVGLNMEHDEDRYIVEE